MAQKKRTTRKKAQEQKVDVEKVRLELVAIREEILNKAREHFVSSENQVRGDLADQSTDLSERELLLGMAESDRQKLRDIESAFEMMDNNTYGVCHECGEPIPVKRLLAVPTAQHCVSCKERVERMGRR
jgi:DnaK suppressor protein